MKKSLYKGISILSDIINPRPEFEPEPKPELVQSDLDSVLNEIFSVDENTGLPKGDLQYYLSKDGNPAVKEWLELNLLQPRAKSNGSSIEGVTDDLIAEMTRSSDETFEDYASRLAAIRDEVIENAKVD